MVGSDLFYESIADRRIQATIRQMDQNTQEVLNSLVWAEKILSGSSDLPSVYELPSVDGSEPIGVSSSF